MKIAVASGKGGTGKTTLAVALAQVAAPVQLLDCDVEAPNTNLSLKLPPCESAKSTVPVPEVDAALCTGCGECAQFCEFNALACLPGSVIVFHELCHSCGGCARICPQGAISEVEREIGEVQMFSGGGISLFQGVLNIGEPMAPPLIRKVKSLATGGGLSIIDCPPGTSCSLKESVHDADAVLLLAEPTPFGLHDLELTVKTLRLAGKPMAVLINRAQGGDNPVRDFCRRENLPVLLEIPDSPEVARRLSEGGCLLDVMPELKSDLLRVLEKLAALEKKS